MLSPEAVADKVLGLATQDEIKSINALVDELTAAYGEQNVRPMMRAPQPDPRFAALKQTMEDLIQRHLDIIQKPGY